MKKVTFTLVFLIPFIFLGQQVHKKTQKTRDFKAEELDTLFNDLYKNQTFNGNVLVAENGEIIYEKSFGLANEDNEDNEDKLNEDTAFELASVTKQFTAMGIVQLQKEGKLSYNDKISEYIPELKSYEGITIKNLLTHTGGLPDYMKLADENWNKSKIATNEDIIQLFEMIKPKKLFKPNEKWKYSNTGYLILATVIERVSGKTFESYLREKIFEPLDMNNTFVYRRRFQPEKVENYAQGYVYSDSLQRKVLPEETGKDLYVVYLDGIVGDGMVNSTLKDLLKWDRALYTNKIINDKDRKMIFSSYQTKDSTETDYGFGWNISNKEPYGKIASHSGGWAGYIAYIERHLDNDKTIILLENNSTPKTISPVKYIRHILYNLPVERPIKLESSLLKLYSGIYLNNKGEEKNIIFENDKLYIPMNSEVKLELIPVSKTKFIVDGFRPEVTYTFILDDNGKVEKYKAEQPEQGIEKVGIRKK